MRLTVLALGSIAVSFISCATPGVGSSGAREGATAYYLQENGASTREFSAQRVEPSSSSKHERQGVTQTRQAVLGALHEVTRSTTSLTRSLHLLKPSEHNLEGRVTNAFTHHVAYGAGQLPWLNGALSGATRLAQASSEVDDLDMERSMLRMTGPRLQAAMFGSTLLAIWVDFLNLADLVLRQSRYYSAERLVVDMHRVQQLIEPSMQALGSLEPGQIETAVASMPALMGKLTREFNSLREAVRLAAQRGGQVMMAAQLIETLTLVSAMKLSLPRLSPTAPATLGGDLLMGSHGVMMGSRLVVSAEWVEQMRRLVQAGVLSVPAVSAAVRIQAGQALMSQAHQELPQGVREALGDGPEVRAMHETGKAGAGMAEPPQHHVLPKEHREWFEKRGFVGEMSIDQFCVELELAHHQAIHGGGNWRLGRTWPREWNQMIMSVLRDAETAAGRILTRNQTLKIVARYMRNYDIPMSFTPWRGR
ncbi:DUF2380 domain-containing protein [Hyalangium rubrum]|uniref:DUF2380 domain-containing protein n=1 Tax=Hyalangium rubrum TaxID=3103134 RepID=A0ABU5GXR2_9BACT|nr:DUF2380 domain-containing protein [Hyalangium sp. s54d21]MDY7225881.1 DUF2380 domain-containing protein [Hyalangium sp. s54d21]